MNGLTRQVERHFWPADDRRQRMRTVATITFLVGLVAVSPIGIGSSSAHPHPVVARVLLVAPLWLGILFDAPRQRWPDPLLLLGCVGVSFLLVYGMTYEGRHLDRSIIVAILLSSLLCFIAGGIRTMLAERELIRSKRAERRQR